MILRFPLSTSLLSLTFLLVSTLWVTNPTVAKQDQPSVQKYKFEGDDRPVADTAPPLYFEDSDNILILTRGGNVLISRDLGGADFKFEPVADVPSGQAFDVVLHPFDKKVAYIWGIEYTHWITEDRGESWRSFMLEGSPVPFRPPFSFHAADSDKVVVNMCTDLFACEEMTYYTTDGFRTKAKELRKNTSGCVYARSTELFKTSPDDKDDNRVVCVVKGRSSSPWSTTDNRIAVSDNYFVDEDEPLLEENRVVQGIVNVAVVKGFLVAAASAKGTDELALYVTDDAKTWHRAVFPKDHKLEQDAYTMLESTNYSIQVDVMTTLPINAMGVLFTSNSNGTYFTRNIEHTNRNYQGLVDFEKVSGIQGIVLVNVVDNWKEIERNPMGIKKLKSKISFDDGRTWSGLTADGDEIHVHSVGDMSNTGRVYSSPAPGMLMAVGNKGKHLQAYEEGDLYVSDDAGLTWRRALKDAHKYEFGDRGAVLVAIYDEGSTDKISYSINHGQKWYEADLGEEVMPKILTTTPDSTSLKFFLMATEGDDIESEHTEHYAFSINFEDLHEGKCKDSDFEQWYARVNEDREPTCIMGHKQWYRRRKPDADCFVDKEFEDPQPQYEPCACAKEDFECDYNFLPSDDGKKCLPAGTEPAHQAQCQSPDDKYWGSSGFRLIPGNDCDREAEGAINLDSEEERSCKEGFKPPASGEITTEITSFRGEGFAQYFYLERNEISRDDDDETIVMRTKENKVYLTRDAGKNWKEIFEGEDITEISPHQHFNDRCFFLTKDETVHYTVNRGRSFGKFEARSKPTGDKLPKLGFHPKFKEWLIWTGAVDCGSSKGECQNVAYFSEDLGASWEHQLRSVGKCEFIKEEGSGGSTDRDKDKLVKDKLVYCEQHKDEVLTEPKQLKYSTTWFATEEKPFDDIIAFATMSEFIVVAARNPENQNALSCHASVDGKNFAEAQFPPKFEVPAQEAYTVLESSNHAIFLHVTVNNQKSSEYGAVIKSNSNGTNYVMSLQGVNRDDLGYVDFEKMLGLEGVILVNQVANIEEVNQGRSKRLRTMISHNDGAQWNPLKAPAKDAEGRPYDCDVSNVDRCSLNIHSYTERQDPRSTFSSPTAIGLMMGVGNVGETLNAKEDADTFMTTDGGISWKSVKKGKFLWRYGDQGSIIVIVQQDVPTQSIFYTLDEGEKWNEYKFADTDFKISYISTVPSDKSRNFVLWGKDLSDRDHVATINIDFSGLTDRQCELNEKDPEAGDYYNWSPKHPNQPDDCLLGHVAQYHRKRVEANCFNGWVSRQDHDHAIARNCACTREDFEWYVSFSSPQAKNQCHLS